MNIQILPNFDHPIIEEFYNEYPEYEEGRYKKLGYSREYKKMSRFLNKAISSNITFINEEHPDIDVFIGFHKGSQPIQTFSESGAVIMMVGGDYTNSNTELKHLTRYNYEEYTLIHELSHVVHRLDRVSNGMSDESNHSKDFQEVFKRLCINKTLWIFEKVYSEEEDYDGPIFEI